MFIRISEKSKKKSWWVNQPKPSLEFLRVNDGKTKQLQHFGKLPFELFSQSGLVPQLFDLKKSDIRLGFISDLQLNDLHHFTQLHSFPYFNFFVVV